MYDIPYFKAANSEDVLTYMQAHPFALICGVDTEGKPVATQVPLILEQRGDKLFLQGHLMRKQDHTNAFLQNPDVLIVFSGAQAYISASWYENQKVASTWNYQAVQATGKMKFLDERFLHHLLIRLTETFESPGSPSLVQDMDPAYVELMMKAIVGFEVEVHSVRHVFKLSQNQDVQSRMNIISRLQTQEGDARNVAFEIIRNNKMNT